MRQSSFPGEWCIYRQREDGRLEGMLGWFDTPGEAIDYAYENWPWWP